MVKYPVVGRLVYNPEKGHNEFFPVEKKHKSLVTRKTVQFKYTFHVKDGKRETVLTIYNVTSWSME